MQMIVSLACWVVEGRKMYSPVLSHIDLYFALWGINSPKIQHCAWKSVSPVASPASGSTTIPQGGR